MYKWKTYQDGLYINLPEGSIEFDIYEVSSLEDIGSIESFKELTNFFRGTYSSLQIPTQTAKLLDEALEDIDLVSLREEFITWLPVLTKSKI